MYVLFLIYSYYLIYSEIKNIVNRESIFLTLKFISLDQFYVGNIVTFFKASGLFLLRYLVSKKLRLIFV